jgi:hypothetical protein
MSGQPSLEPIYTTVQSVKVRLLNKVQFQQSPEVLLDGELADDLLLQLIIDAETDVEKALRGRYAVPFRSIARGTFANLPNHTQRAIRQAVDMKAVIKVLGTDFGSGTAVNGDNYRKTMVEDYEETIRELLGMPAKDASDAQIAAMRTFTRPPLEDLMLAASNSKADDGYKGMIQVSNPHGDRREGAEQFAADHINNPALGIAPLNGGRFGWRP